MGNSAPGVVAQHSGEAHFTGAEGHFALKRSPRVAADNFDAPQRPSITLACREARKGGTSSLVSSGANHISDALTKTAVGISKMANSNTQFCLEILLRSINFVGRLGSP